MTVERDRSLRESEVGIDRGEVAAIGVLRRIQGVAVALAFLGAVVAASTRGVGSALTLTVAAVVSIVSLRSLEAAVRRLRAGADGKVEGGATRFSLRWTILLVILSATLILGSRDALALLVGFSVLPGAAMIEAGLQVCEPWFRRDPGPGSN